MREQASHLDKARLTNLADEIWKSAERLRGKFKAHEYQVVVLPIITIRRLECVLIQWREQKAGEIRSKRKNISDEHVEKLVKGLELNAKQSPGFSNATTWTLRKIYEEDHTLLEKNFRAYLNGFSDTVQDILESFDYRAVIGKMVKNARLAPILNQYSTLDLGPDQLSSLEMGYIYEELLRRFSEAHAEKAGDHFTPREVIRLMVELLEIPVPEALHIREVSEEKLEDESILQTVAAHQSDLPFLESVFKGQVNVGIQDAYALRALYEQLGDPKYTDKGAIFDIMAYTVIQKGLELADAG